MDSGPCLSLVPTATWNGRTQPGQSSFSLLENNESHPIIEYSLIYEVWVQCTFGIDKCAKAHTTPHLQFFISLFPWQI